MIENLGPNVARLCKNANLTQEQLAQAIDVKKQTISKLERGAGYPRMETLELIAEYFHATPTQLFGTAQEIAISDTPAIMAQIDKYDNAVQRLLAVRNFMSGKTIADIDRTVESIETIKTFFQPQTVYIEDEHGITDEPEIDENGKIRKNVSAFDQIPFDKLREVEQLVNLAKDYADKVSKPL
ncbi:helix-turn-helix transcriptional regulator [Latilactobacillus sakei subsp. sakei]|uniref:helix-turn-helix domain-containing protein n=1 Tax=Latilactobacillus sakei TaxID=1599 RepID=UPI00285599D0|nr:helix-turn-helix transcriptional regulator [Latilactobacillus sakei]MDR7925101.1 helix-turn-helix transcriptional regulator [Latilactobacillus sakei subsp. sakei]